MAVRIITGEDGEQVLYDSVTMTAFGVVHEDEDFAYESFLEWLKKDARSYSDAELNSLYYEWLKEMRDEKAFDQYDGGYEGDGNFAANH